MMRLPAYVEVGDLFPNPGIPEKNFVHRRSQGAGGLTYTSKLKHLLDSGSGRAIQITGASQTGKTVLFKHCLEELKAENAEITIFQFTGDDIRETGDFWRLLKNSLKISENKPEVNKNIGLITPIGGAGIQITNPSEQVDIEEKVREVLPIKAIIIIDDFHVIPAHVRRALVRIGKGLIGNSSKAIKFVLVFIPTRDVTNSDTYTDMLGRFEEIHLPLWKFTDLCLIAKSRLKEETQITLLGAEIFARECYGLPSIMQDLCRKFCEHHFPDGKILVEERSIDLRREPNTVQLVLSEVAATTWRQGLKGIHTTLVGKKRDLSEDKRRFRWLIWYALTTKRIEATEGLKFHDCIEIELGNLHERLKQLKPEFHLQDDIKVLIDNEANLLSALREMRDEDMERYMERAKAERKEFVSDPVLDFDDYNDTILIYSPRFLMTLRNIDEGQNRFR